MRADALLIGAMSGGDTLPQLRAAMRAADAVAGAAAPHVHPRIEAVGARAAARATPGFVEPVVDIDRVQVSYPSLDRLVADLRAMGATNILLERAALHRQSRAAAAAATPSPRPATATRTVETFEILHFAAWTPAEGLKRALTLSAGRVVNPAAVKPAAWTWTRGGWRDRYPNNVAHAPRRPARSDCDRIWA